MISEERLEDIIQNKGSVWCIDKRSRPYRAVPVIFERDEEIGANKFIAAWGKKNIFETEEEAEEYLKYGNITRTEKLELPTWKQVEKFIEQMKHFNLNHDDRVLSRIVTKDSIYYLKLCKDLDTFYFELKQTYIGDDLCEQMINKLPKSLGRATKENYRKALDICVKLFKGEEV